MDWLAHGPGRKNCKPELEDKDCSAVLGSQAFALKGSMTSVVLLQRRIADKPLLRLGF
jgi:hypothetical protein